jgi:hypothetical protein
VQRFVAMLERHSGHHAGPKSAWCWQPHAVVNADETRFGYSDGSVLVLAPKNAGKVSTPVYRDPTTLTVVPFVTARGEVLFTTFICKHEKRADKKTSLRRWFDFDDGRAASRKDRHLYCKTWTSKTGFVNKTMWRQIMAAFVAAARKQ